MRLTRHRKRWAVVINGKRYSTGVPIEHGRDLAERKARDIARAIARQTAGQTCGEIMNAWLADMPNRANPKQVGHGSFYAVQNAAKFFGDHYPEEVTREECRAYIHSMREAGKSDGTIRKNLGALAAALRWRDPSTPAVLELPPAPPPRDRWLSREELQCLVKAAKPSPHITIFIHLAIATGGRKEAILQLRWDTHIDFDRRSVWLGFKEGGKGRATVPMTQRLFDELTKAREATLSDYVVEWAGKPVKDVKNALRKAYERAGLGDVPAPAHVLRHTSGAYMAMAGVPMLEISRRLGHSSIQVTERHYAHFAPDSMQASTKALEI